MPGQSIMNGGQALRELDLRAGARFWFFNCCSMSHLALVKSWIRNVLACTIPGSQPWIIICTNYLMHGEFRKTIVAQLMIAPYGRIIIMHISSIVAAFPVMALG